MLGLIAAIQSIVTALTDRLTAIRAAYLDYINTLNGRLTTTLATNLGTTNTYVARLSGDLTTARCTALASSGGYWSVQHHDNISITADSTDHPVTAVDQTKSFIRLNWTVDGTDAWSTTWAGLTLDYITADLKWFPLRAKFTSNTNVRIERGSHDVNMTACLTVIEWKTS